MRFKDAKFLLVCIFGLLFRAKRNVISTEKKRFSLRRGSFQGTSHALRCLRNWFIFIYLVACRLRVYGRVCVWRPRVSYSNDNTNVCYVTFIECKLIISVRRSLCLCEWLWPLFNRTRNIHTLLGCLENTDFENADRRPRKHRPRKPRPRKRRPWKRCLCTRLRSFILL